MRRTLVLGVLAAIVWGIATAFVLGLFLEAQRHHGTTAAFWGIVVMGMICAFVASTKGEWGA